jgi:hypothetical protein
MANERKSASRKEFMEKIRLTVLEKGIINLRLSPKGVTAEDIQKEFRSFEVKTIGDTTCVAMSQRV